MEQLTLIFELICRTGHIIAMFIIFTWFAVWAFGIIGWAVPIGTFLMCLFVIWMIR